MQAALRRERSAKQAAESRVQNLKQQLDNWADNCSRVNALCKAAVDQLFLKKAECHEQREELNKAEEAFGSARQLLRKRKDQLKTTRAELSKCKADLRETNSLLQVSCF